MHLNSRTIFIIFKIFLYIKVINNPIKKNYIDLSISQYLQFFKKNPKFNSSYRQKNIVLQLEYRIQKNIIIKIQPDHLGKTKCNTLI